MSTASINCHSKKVRHCYILHTVLLSNHITIDNYYYLLSLCKTRRYNIKWEIMNLKSRTCYYFDDTIKLEYFDLDNILINKKSHENILIYDISYKTLIDSTPLCIRFNKIDEFIRIYDGTRHLTLFGSEKYDVIYSRIRYLISLKSGIIYDWHGSLTIGKILKLHNVIIHLKPVLKKDKNHYYYKIFLEKYLF